MDRVSRISFLKSVIAGAGESKHRYAEAIDYIASDFYKHGYSIVSECDLDPFFGKEVLCSLIALNIESLDRRDKIEFIAKDDNEIELCNLISQYYWSLSYSFVDSSKVEEKIVDLIKKSAKSVAVESILEDLNLKLGIFSSDEAQDLPYYKKNSDD